MVSGRWAWHLLIATSVLMGVGLWVVAWAPTYGLFIILAAVAGAGRSGVMLVNQSILMSNTRPEYFGRVMSWVLIAFGLQAFLAPVWGAIADAVGRRETLLIVGVIVFAGTALMALAWLRTRHIPAESGTGAAHAAGDTSDDPAAPPPTARPSRTSNAGRAAAHRSQPGVQRGLRGARRPGRTDGRSEIAYRDPQRRLA